MIEGLSATCLRILGVKVLVSTLLCLHVLHLSAIGFHLDRVLLEFAQFFIDVNSVDLVLQLSQSVDGLLHESS